MLNYLPSQINGINIKRLGANLFLIGDQPTQPITANSLADKFRENGIGALIKVTEALAKTHTITNMLTITGLFLTGFQVASLSL